MTEFLITSLVIVLMASLAVNGYFYGLLKAMRSASPIKEPEIRKEPAMTFGVPSVPRQPQTEQADQNQRPGVVRRIVSPSEAIAKHQQAKDGIVSQPKVPPAVKNDFLKDAGAVVAQAAN